MKFRIKQNKNITPILEGTPLPSVAPQNIATERTSDRPGANRPAGPSLDRIIALNQFMQDARKNSLPIDITIPGDFNNQISLPPAPQDLQVLMSTVRTNKARKTRDLEKWGMVDPITTYNIAPDECNKSFQSFFEHRIQLAGSKEEIKTNKQTVMKPSKESIEYNYNNELYESAVGLGAKFGLATGAIANSGLAFMGAAGATFAAAIAPSVAAIMTSTDLIGKAGYRLFGDIDNNNKNTNDDVAAPFNGPEMAVQATKVPMNYGNVVEAFDDYINGILQASRELISGLSTSLSQKYDSEFADYVLDIQTLSADKVKEYIKQNSEAAKKQREQQEKLDSLKQSNENNLLRKKAIVYDRLTELIKKSKGDTTYVEKLTNIMQYYATNQNKNLARDIFSKIDGGDIDGAIKLYDDSTKSGSENKLHDSIQYNSNLSPLNEAEYSEGGRLQLDLSDYYKQLKNDLNKKLGKVLGEFDPKNMVNLAETKQLMEDIIKGADDAIKERIQLITKASSGTSGTSSNSGLGEKALEFLAGHPIEATNLTELWSRHLADLKMRMNNRIKIMTDYNNSTRSLGWTLSMLRTTLPDFFARMLTYRYAYAILSNEGFYSYTTEQAERDIALFDSPLDASNPSLGTVGEAYASSARAIIINVLHNHGQQYTDGEPCLSVDENGGYALSNTIRYGSLLYNQLNESASTYTKAVAGTTFANLPQNQDGADQLINYINGQLSASGIPVSLDDLIRRVTLPNEMVKAKNTIKQTYDNIIDVIGPKAIDNAKQSKEKAQQIADSLFIINRLGHENIYNNYVNHKKDVDSIIKKINQDTSISNNDKKKINEDINTYFEIDSSTLSTIPKNPNNSYAESIESLFAKETNNAKNDYYSYILSWYSNEHGFADVSINPFENTNNINRICNMTSALLSLAATGVLAYTIEEDKKDTVLNIEEQLPEIRNTIIKLYDGVNLLNTINGVFVGNTNSSSSVVSSSINQLEQLQTQESNVFRQLQDTYNKKSNGHYAIENLFLLRDPATGGGRTLSIITDAGIYDSLVQTIDTSNNIRDAFKDASIRIVRPTGAPIRFDAAPISDKNTILNDIYNTIKETRDKGDLSNYENLIDKIKKYCEEQQSQHLPKNSSTQHS